MRPGFAASGRTRAVRSPELNGAFPRPLRCRNSAYVAPILIVSPPRCRGNPRRRAAREFGHGLLADDVDPPARQWRGRADGGFPSHKPPRSGG